MIDLSSIARKLQLSVEQIRIAADLLQQGYQPAFIQQYRADESGRLPREALWTLKLEIDRQQRLANAKVRLASQLPKDADLDDEAKKFIEQADTEVDIETALRAFRARRGLSTSQQPESRAGELLEKLVAYSGPHIEDLPAWVAEQLSVDAETATDTLTQTQRMIGTMLLCDTGLTKELRTLVQRRAQIRVELCDSNKPEPEDAQAPASAAAAADAPAASAEGDTPAENAAADSDATESQVAETASVTASEADSAPASSPASEPAAPVETTVSSEPTAEPEPAAATDEPVAAETTTAAEVPTTEPSAAMEAAAATEAEIASAETTAPSTDATPDSDASQTPTPEGGTIAADWPKAGGKKAKAAAKLAKKASKKDSKSKQLAKLTPRQRRRRWLIAMINPMKSLKKPLGKLSAYQLLMLGRGRRSQIVETHLQYDLKALVPLARDRFVAKDHPLSRWFSATVESALDGGVRSKIESDAISELEERGTESLLTKSVEGLRKTLLQRPVRGHRIMVVDTVGPKVAAVAIVDQAGNVLATDEIPCSALAETVTQNVTRLGELAHKYRVTLIALTNGPARRFLVHTLRELVNQSAASGLRWTMADRSGADAYAAGRVSLRELSAFNRRDRAAIWVARSLQDPLTQYLKVGINRLRLGSFQRELPQEPLKKLVRETIADCVAVRGVDVHSASVAQLLCVPGLHDDQAQQIATLAAQGKIESRSQLLQCIEGWTESQSRQAIGMLRVFGSEQTFDATAIHPDDYKLASRIVEGTELEAPPAAPEGWEKPTPISEEEASNNAAADHKAESEPAEGDEPTAETEPPAEETVAEDTASVDSSTQDDSTESSASEAASAQQPAVAEPAAEAPTAETPAAPQSAEAPTEGATAEQTTESIAAETAGEAAQSSDAPTEAGPVEANQPKPEYSEDVKSAEKVKLPIDVEKLARGWQVGRERLLSIAHALHDPFADPRLSRSPVPMLVEMPTMQNLSPGQCLWAVVVGVADFGAFVELGPDCGGLIHISRLFDRYVEDPHEVVQVGDLVMTWVVTVDEKKGRVALTALSPEQTAASAAANGQHQGRGERRPTGGGPRGGAGRGDSRGGQNRGSQAGGGRTGAGGNRGGKPSGDRAGGRASGNRGPGGNRGGGRDRNRSRGPSKPVIVTSKKPKDPITSAMKEGEDPLRSFSDLLQFYEAKRTDDVPPPKAKSVGNQDLPEKAKIVTPTAQPPAEVEVTSEPETAPASEKPASVAPAAEVPTADDSTTSNPPGSNG